MFASEMLAGKPLPNFVRGGLADGFVKMSAYGPAVSDAMGLPDATVAVLQGMIFVAILAGETLYGRFAWFQPGLRSA